VVPLSGDEVKETLPLRYLSVRSSCPRFQPPLGPRVEKERWNTCSWTSRGMNSVLVTDKVTVPSLLLRGQRNCISRFEPSRAFLIMFTITRPSITGVGFEFGVSAAGFTRIFFPFPKFMPAEEEIILSRKSSVRRASGLTGIRCFSPDQGPLGPYFVYYPGGKGDEQCPAAFCFPRGRLFRRSVSPGCPWSHDVHDIMEKIRSRASRRFSLLISVM